MTDTELRTIFDDIKNSITQGIQDGFDIIGNDNSGNPIDKLKGGGSKAGALINIGNAAIDILASIGERDIALRKSYLEKEAKVIEIGIERQSKILSQGMKSIVNGFSKNAVEMAYDMTKVGYDLAKTSAKTAMDLKIAQKTYAKNVKEANLQFTTGLIGGAAVIGAAIGTAIAPGVGTIIGGVIGLIGAGISKFGGLSIKQMELELKQQEMTSNFTQNFLDKAQKITEPWDDLYKQTTDFVLKINDAGLKFGATIGYTGDKFRDTFANTMIEMSQKTLENGSNLAKMFGKEAEKIPEYMENYITTSSRAVGMTATDIGNIMSTGRLFGMSGAEATGLYGSMNIFNTSISSASDTMGIMYHQITRMGLSSKKFGKDLVENLKLAQKYNFKGGVDNMMKLTKWAQQTRFNLNNAASFADKIMNGSLSDALETSAKLQVLGGSAAMYSDPLGMLYDAGANIGDLAKRQAAMFDDISGTFNKKTGETDFSWYENRMIAARAQAAGIDVETARNMVRQRNKQGVIDNLLNGMDEDDRLAIGNRATYNKKNNRWEVVDIHGETHDINEYKNKTADINDLLPVETEEAILTVAEKSLTHLESLDNAVVDRYTRLGNVKKSDVLTNADNQRKEIDKVYDNKENFEKIKQIFDFAADYSLNMIKAQTEIMKTGISDPKMIEKIYTGFYNSSVEFINDKETFNTFKSSVDKFEKGINKLITDYIGIISGEKERQKNVQKAYEQDAKPTAPGINNKSASALNDMAYEAQKRGDESTSLWTSVAAGLADIKDGYGSTNGGVILGASKVKSISDGAVNVKTSNRDQYLAAETGGPIDILLKQILPGLQMLINGNGSSNGNVNLNLNGKLELSQNGSSVNLVDMIKNDPATATKFLAVLQKTMEVNQNGKSVTNHKIS